MHEIKYNISSRIGGRKENQDSFGSANTPHGLLIVVCDGMGGAKGGKTASELAVKTILEQVESSEFIEADEILIEAINAANRNVYQSGIANPELHGMGTTVVALLIDEHKATTAHVGDSRIYQIRGSRKVFRTFDHSMVFELVKRGAITEEQARLSAESNVILRALGIKPEIEVEINRNLSFLTKDRFLLCSDGICGAVGEIELIRMIACHKPIEHIADNLAKTIDQLGIDKGGKHDNLTAAIIEVNSNSKIKPKMDRKSKLIIGTLTILLLTSLLFYAIQLYDSPQSDNTKSDVEFLQNEIKELNNSLQSANDDFNLLKQQMSDLLDKQKEDSIQTDRTLIEVTELLKEIEKSSNDKEKKVISTILTTIKKLNQL